ncbi:MAG: hypothetical protein AB1634_15220, partial [Thermodesulfobacteriota bacterium]
LVSPEDEGTAVTLLQTLQKRLKYGLPSEVSILLYEAGFADRPLAIELAEVVPEISAREELKAGLRRKRRAAEAVLTEYPAYFRRVFERVVG